MKAKSFSRRDFFKIAGFSAASLALNGCSTYPLISSARKPNILFIFADDQTYNALGALGSGEVKTPNLDKLVHCGTVFTHAYNQGAWNGAVCIASRCMLNTGRFVWNACKLDQAAGAMEQERIGGRLWSGHMQKAGYETYFSGKWHVKADADKAFEHVAHVRGGMPQDSPECYNRPIEGEEDKWNPWDTKHKGYWQGGRHWSEVLGDDAEEFLAVASKSDKPFFMYLAFNAPHDPRQSPKEYVDMYPQEKIKVPESFLPEYPYNEEIGCGRSLRDERLGPFPRTEYSVRRHRQEYYAIITHMDAQIGRILDALERSGKADDTYIFFTADHGLAVGSHGLMGKQNMFDHSVRVPLIINGPGIKKQTKTDTPVYLQDIMPTTLELAGIDKPDYVQFASLMPIIEGKRKSNYDSIYGAYMDKQRMIIKGCYKMIIYPMCQTVLLYDLKADPKELNNLSDDPGCKSVLGDMFDALLKLQHETEDTLDLSSPNLARVSR